MVGRVEDRLHLPYAGRMRKRSVVIAAGGGGWSRESVGWSFVYAITSQSGGTFPESGWSGHSSHPSIRRSCLPSATVVQSLTQRVAAQLGHDCAPSRSPGSAARGTLRPSVFRRS